MRQPLESLPLKRQKIEIAGKIAELCDKKAHPEIIDTHTGPSGGGGKPSLHHCLVEEFATLTEKSASGFFFLSFFGGGGVLQCVPSDTAVWLIGPVLSPVPNCCLCQKKRRGGGGRQ